MNNEKVNELIKGIGLITELWMITYKNFVAQGLSAKEATMQTKEFMAIMMESMIGTNNTEG